VDGDLLLRVDLVGVGVRVRVGIRVGVRVRGRVRGRVREGDLLLRVGLTSSCTPSRSFASRPSQVRPGMTWRVKVGIRARVGAEG
jgi:hypothetical protein